MADDSFRDFVLEQLDGLQGLTCRRMFGCHGLYSGTTFFGIVCRGALFFRTDAQSRAEYLRRGMRPFMPKPQQSLKAYYEVPADVLENPDTLAEWARRAMLAKDA